MTESFSIDTNDSFVELLSLIKDNKAKILSRKNDVFDIKINNNVIKFYVDVKYVDKLSIFDNQSVDRLVHGKDKTSNIVNVSIVGDKVYTFTETNGIVSHSISTFKRWALSSVKMQGFEFLKGSEHYNCIGEFDDAEWQAFRKQSYKKDIYTAWNPTENYLIKSGVTYFKNMKLSDVSSLSFDIETTGVNPNAKDARVLLITYAYKKNNVITREALSIDDYVNEAHLIQHFCEAVVKLDPSIIIGHNIIMFDIPYLNTRYKALTEENLPLGRLGYRVEISERTKAFRKDGSQSYDYYPVSCFGRELVDTFFLAIKTDISRKYDSYGLKAIVKAEGLEKHGRQHYDAAKIKDYWNVAEEKAKIIQYGLDDAEDPIKLYELMAAPLFYFTQSVPKSFQVMVESATGSQLNSMMVRSYIQDGWSVAKASPSTEFEGAISIGNPGVYSNVIKWDVSSLYPSIMRQYKIGPGSKDYNNNFLKLIEYFTEERLKNKRLAKETGDRYYKDLEQVQKIGINSGYGFLGAPGLNYNNPLGAASVTRYGREILTKAIDWSAGLGLTLVNADTDSISVTKQNEEVSEEDRNLLLKQLNDLYPKLISWEDDGYYKKIIVIKAKNYILYDGKNIKLKGSSLRDQKKEPALKEMLVTMIDALLDITDDNLEDIYLRYICEALSPKDIKRWCQKKTITKAVLDCRTNPDARLNERKVFDAITSRLESFQEGDKVWVYPGIKGYNTEVKVYKNGKTKETITADTCLYDIRDWDNNNHDKDKLVERVYATTEILSNIIDKDTFLNYTLKVNAEKLKEMM